MKQGDILTFVGDEIPTIIYRCLVLGVCGSIIFTHDLHDDGSVGSPVYREESDLMTMGWKVEPAV